MNSRDVMRAARRLMESGTVQPTQTDLRRAASAAYYVMLRALAGTAVDPLVGSSLEWHLEYLCNGRKSVRVKTMNQRLARSAISARR